MFPIPGLSDHYCPVKTEVFFLYQSQFCSVNIFLILSRKNASKLLETPALWFWGMPNPMGMVKVITLKPLPLDLAHPKTSMFPIPGLSDHYCPVKTEVFFLYQSQFCSVNIFLILSRKNASKLLETPTLWFWGMPNPMGMVKVITLKPLPLDLAHPKT